MAELRQHFRPEFLNRIDDVILFHRLDQAQLERIVELQLRQLEERLAQRRLQLQVRPAARAWLAEHGYDPVYGARPLRRVLQRQLGDRIATAVLQGDFGEGDTIVVDTGPDGLVLSRGQGSVPGPDEPEERQAEPALVEVEPVGGSQGS
jgi:ATP-dependent Clp protease ATP-binding subunit ClpB